jgi:xanthine dehydrogenase accessory factor
VKKELELWQFIAERLNLGESVMLLVVAESSGSSPGRAGYKMAVGADGSLCGSIGGGVMEVNLVEQSRALLSEPGAVATGFRDSVLLNPRLALSEQVHQRNSPNSSGMICSGRQAVIFSLLTPENATAVDSIIKTLIDRTPAFLTITPAEFRVMPPEGGTQNADRDLYNVTDEEFIFREKLGYENDLYIIGGGHCALALSELMSKMDFRIFIFDDRPELNTIEKNRFAHEITIIESYEKVGEFIPSGVNTYVVVMTLGYNSDETVIRQLIERDFKYFGVLGSKAKMATLLRELKNEGLPPEKLDRIYTPIGLPINSHTPEEIAVSIAAEIIAVKNAETA